MRWSRTMEQRRGATRTPRGGTVACATAGSGAPLLFVGGWLSHLELGWALPAERLFLERLAEGRRLIRYDRPGCGLSDRETPAPSVEAELEVVAAVLVEVGVERTDVVASSLGVPLMIEWAARHPEAVGRLALYGGRARRPALRPPQGRRHVAGRRRGPQGLPARVPARSLPPGPPPGPPPAPRRSPPGAPP